MSITKAQEAVLREFKVKFDLVCYHEGEPIDIDQAIDVFKGIKPVKGENVEERLLNFKKLVYKFGKDKYPVPFMKEFSDYWTQINDGGKRMLFEMQAAFQMPNRLAASWTSRSWKYAAPKDQPALSVAQTTTVKHKDLF